MSDYEALLERAKESPTLHYPALAGAIRELVRERDELRGLLEVSDKLARHALPFVCDEKDCAHFGHRVQKHSCDCYDGKRNLHHEAVLAALAGGRSDE